MDLNKLFQSKILKIIFFAIGALIILLLVFKTGVFVGYRKASFSYRWGENYHRNFAGPRGGFFGNFRSGFGDKDFIDAHGAFGSILKIDGNTIIVKGGDGVEKIVIVAYDTVIRKGRENVKLSDLKFEDRVVIIGLPDSQGKIEAKLIRVFDNDANDFLFKHSRSRFLF